MARTGRSKRSSPASHLSPRELAAALGISESSLKRWADEGRLVAERTAGGHRRIPLTEAVRFVRAAGLSVVNPEVLGLAAAEGVRARGGGLREGAAELLYRALLDDRSDEARGLIVAAYLDGVAPGPIFDELVRPALAGIGELWRHEPAGIFVEHRATETCVRALVELAQVIAPAADDAPVAIGGGWAGDVYRLPTMMAGLVLADAGYRVRNLGPDTPPEATIAAIRHHRPDLVWQSLSVAPPNPRAALSGLERIGEVAAPGTLVVGGRASDALPLPLPAGIHRIESMTELGAFARGGSAARRGN
jgi:MerR family transcriptional regulator, light-induced transcriptional regulator